MIERKPVYLLAGGRGTATPEGIFKSVLTDIGRTDPTIAYVGVANEDSREFFARMSAMIRAAGECHITHVLIFPRGADLKRARDELERADAVFVSGGDVELGMKVLKDKGMTPMFQRLFAEGKLLFGVSAGSIMLAREWVRWTDPDDDSTAELFPCLGVAPVLCDTHGEAEKWEELQAALSLKPEGTLGFGITSGTCLKVMPDGTPLALGGAIYRYFRTASGVRREPDLLPSHP